MNAAVPNTVRTTHFVSAEISRAIAEANMSVTDLAHKAVLSEVFIRSVLVGEDGLGRLINIDFLQTIADTTGRTMTIKIVPAQRRIRAKTVKGAGK